MTQSRWLGAKWMGALLAVALAPTAAALAQNSGTEAEQEACTPDVFRLCQAYVPNEEPIVACLKANRARLSPACHQVFFPAAPPAPATTPNAKHHKHKHHRRAD